MRLHSDYLSHSHVYAAARFAGVTLDRFNDHGSRKRNHAFDVTLHGSSSRRPNNRTGDGYAATYDEWGMFLGYLYRVDPEMFCTGGGQYESADHFNWITGSAFASETMSRSYHKQHRWEFKGNVCTGSYGVHECKCGAILRFMNHGHRFAELAAV